MALFKRQRALQQVHPGDLGYARVHASLTNPAGPAREAAIAASAAGMTAGASVRPTRYFTYPGANGAPTAIAWIKDQTSDRAGAFEVFVGVDPVLRRFGLGTTVFDLALARARKLGATTITSFASDPEGIAFLQGNGFRATQSMGEWTAPLATVAAAEVALPPGYRVRCVTDACPPELATARAALQEAFEGDAPHGDAPEPGGTWDAARIHAWFAENSGAGRHFVEALLFHGSEPVGFSNVIVYDGSPQASQRDTYVAAGHRGHALARALKAATAGELVAHHPGVQRLRTFVDLGNDPMNATNAGLGYVQRGVMVVAERPIDVD